MLRFRSDRERNFWLLYLEAFLATFTGVAGVFAGAFAIRLGASNTEIGLMNSLPPLLVIFVSIPFGRILQKSSHKLFWAIGGISLYRIGYMLFALSPLVHGSFLTPSMAFIALFVLIAIPIQFFNIGNVGMMIDVVPDHYRATVFTVRNMIGSLANIGGVFLAGLWLSQHAFPENYQALFIVSGMAAFLSLFCWLSIRYPQTDPQPGVAVASVARTPSLKHQIQELSHVFRGQPMFFRFMTNTLLLNIGMWMAGPLYTLYTIKQLSASDAWIGWNGTISSICGLLGWLAGQRLIRRWGDTMTHRRLVIIMALYPLLIGLSPSLTLILLFNALTNLLSPTYSLSNYTLWLKVLPEAQREDAAAINNTAMSIGSTIFPLVGVSLSGILGIPATLIGCGMLAVIGSISFWIWKIQVSQPIGSEFIP